MKKYKDYLGDSVYAEYFGELIILTTTNNGDGASNMIYLEEEVYQALVRFHDRIVGNKTNEKNCC